MEVQMMFVLLVSVICLSKVSPSVGQVVAGGRSGGGDRRPSDPGRVDPNGGESYMDRFGPGSQPSSPTRDRYNSGPSRSHSLPSGSTGDRYNPGPSRSNSLPNGRYDDDRDRYDTNRDRYDSNSDRYDTNRDRYDTNRDRYDTNRDRYDDTRDRYDTNRDRYDDNRDRYDDNRDRYDDNRDRYDNTGPNRGPNTRPGPDTGDRYNPRPGPETEGPQKPRNCPNTLDQWESSMNRCLSPLTSLPRRSSIVDKCKAYRAAEPCVDGLQLCKRDHPRIDYYKSKAIDTWRDMEREAEIYGVCHNIRARDLGM